MRFKSIISVLLCLLLLFSLTACGEKEPSDGADPSTVTVTDLLGREIELVPASFKRVVCIGAGALRMYSYVGDMSLLCGVEDIDNTSLDDRPSMFDDTPRPYIMAYGEGLTDLPSCGKGGPMAQAAEAEKLLSCEPDIVISEIEDAEKSDILAKQLGVPVITLRAGADGVFDKSFAESLSLLGRIFGREARASALIDYVKTEQAAIENAVKDIPDGDKPNVYLCGLGNWGTASHLTTSASYAPLRVAGVKNAVGDIGVTGATTLEEETFVALGDKVDLIILDAAAVKNIGPALKEDGKLFSSFSAWEDGEVYLTLAYNAYYTNFEIALINTWYIAKTVYPDLFADLDIKAKADEITEKFVGTPLADEMYALPQSYGGYQQVDVDNFFER